MGAQRPALPETIKGQSGDVPPDHFFNIANQPSFPVRQDTC